MKYLDRLRDSFHTSFECLNPTLSTLRVPGFTQLTVSVTEALKEPVLPCYCFGRTSPAHLGIYPPAYYITGTAHLLHSVCSAFSIFQVKTLAS